MGAGRYGRGTSFWNDCKGMYKRSEGCGGGMGKLRWTVGPVMCVADEEEEEDGNDG